MIRLDFTRDDSSTSRDVTKLISFASLTCCHPLQRAREGPKSNGAFARPIVERDPLEIVPQSAPLTCI